MLMSFLLTRILKMLNLPWVNLGLMLKTFTGKHMEKPYCYAKVKVLKSKLLELRTSRQQHRQNIPSNNSSDYYKCTTTIPYLIILLVS